MKSASALKEHRHNGLIDLPSTRLILLDTLDQTPGPAGKLGAEQIAWVLAKIDEVPTKQVILVGHHNPQVGGAAPQAVSSAAAARIRGSGSGLDAL